MKRRNSLIALILVVAISLLSMVACNMTPFGVAVCERSDYGNAILNVSLMELNERGINIGDKVRVSVGEFNEVLVLVDEIEKEEGKVQFWCDNEDGSIDLLIYNGDFMKTYGVSVGDVVTLTK